jgi:hypothetical protein
LGETLLREHEWIEFSPEGVIIKPFFLASFGHRHPSPHAALHQRRDVMIFVSKMI